MLGILPASSTTSEWLLGASVVSSFLRWSSGLVTFSWSTSWFLLNLPHGNLTAKAKLRHHYLMSESDWELGAPDPYWQQGCPTCNPMQTRCEGPAAVTSLHFSSELPSCWPDRALSVTNSFVASKVSPTFSAPLTVLHHKKCLKLAGTWVLQSKAIFGFVDKYILWRKMVWKETGCFQGITSLWKWMKINLRVQEKLSDNSRYDCFDCSWILRYPYQGWLCKNFHDIDKNFTNAKGKQTRLVEKWNKNSNSKTCSWVQQLQGI